MNKRIEVKPEGVRFTVLGTMSDEPRRNGICHQLNADNGRIPLDLTLL